VDTLVDADDPRWLEQIRAWPEALSVGGAGTAWAPLLLQRGHSPVQPHLCRCCGLRLLHLWLNNRDWVRRRTRAVTFLDDRTVRRHGTLDSILPDYAPSLSLGGGPWRHAPSPSCTISGVHEAGQVVRPGDFDARW
jgi:hypothetical protein